MGCCSGECGCGKSEQTPVQEQMFLARLSTEKGVLSSHVWMEGLNSLRLEEEIIEVRFKNNRKEFFRNSRSLRMNKDDRVVVNVDGGRDVGTVSLTGAPAKKQFDKKGSGRKSSSLNQVHRIANETDLEKWLKVRREDRPALLKCREMAASLNLKMSIADVELSGDGKKLTLYYMADGIVDFRELLNRCMHEFKMKVELSQVGINQNTANPGS